LLRFCWLHSGGATVKAQANYGGSSIEAIPATFSEPSASHPEKYLGAIPARARSLEEGNQVYIRGIPTGDLLRRGRRQERPSSPIKDEQYLLLSYHPRSLPDRASNFLLFERLLRSGFPAGNLPKGPSFGIIISPLVKEAEK
jgi:hypothetical protein